MSGKRARLAGRRSTVGQSATAIRVDTEHLERVARDALDAPEDVVAFWIPLGDIRQSPYQYRYHLDDARLDALARSIAAQELYQPITVRPLQAGTYEVVLGHRRLEAFRRLGRGAIPAIVREYDDAQAVRALLDENLKRADTNLFEQTEGVVRLLALQLGLPGDPVVSVRRVLDEMRSARRTDGALSDAAHLEIASTIADVTGMTWESFLTNRLSVYRLPERLQEEVRRGLPYSLAVAVGRADPSLHDAALDFLRLPTGWRTREEFKVWLDQGAQLRPSSASARVSARRLKRIAARVDGALTPERQARFSELLDELERLLHP
ncbi:ParB/RepB/Spo0J family partition protein [Deinococcus pimensis]|uniref:ParB/RepB/Spo0J family partition protein n=1 Tax=Deinococcus pimensis TaxID=309888 RepID=UPI0004820872|nr:ParB/RepB/Spo0J family partition protein [Deinococcus pimensis]